MIRWNKTITVKTNNNGEVFIHTDRNQKWMTFAIDKSSTPITDWWEMNAHTELREWQKDAVIKPLCDIFGQGKLFIIYEKGRGYNQSHDLTMANWNDIWVLSTHYDVWLWKTSYYEYTINPDESFGSILDFPVRNEWYKVLDGLKSKESIIR